jgi:hypothetical protein
MSTKYDLSTLCGAFDATVVSAALLVAHGIISNAADNNEDPLTYSTSEEVVELYLKDIASDISDILPYILTELLTTQLLTKIVEQTKGKSNGNS